MSTRNFVPRANQEGNIGTSLKTWLKGWFKDLFISNNLTDGTKNVAISEIRDFIDSKAQSNGLASLDAASKIPINQLPSTILGQVFYKGTWDASINVPLLGASGVGGTQGEYYVVDIAGSSSVDGITDWKVGDWIINNGVAWEKVDNTDQVISVAGKQGIVTLIESDITNLDKYTKAEVDSLVGGTSTVPTKTTNYTLTDNDTIILVDTTVGNIIITLPTAVGREGKIFTIKRIITSNNNLIIAPNGLETIDENTTIELKKKNYSIDIISNNINWYII